jgi:hypothetical protein
MAAIFPGSEYDLCLWGNLKQKVYILELKLLRPICEMHKVMYENNWSEYICSV